MKLIAMGLLLVGSASLLLAGAVPQAPEIDPVTGVGALALLSGGLLVLRARQKK